MIQIHNIQHLEPIHMKHHFCHSIKDSEHNIAIGDKLHMHSIMHSLHSRLEWTGMVNGQFIGVFHVCKVSV